MAIVRQGFSLVPVLCPRRCVGRFPVHLFMCCLMSFVAVAAVHAQDSSSSSSQQQDNGTVRVQLPTVTVTAQKEPVNIQDTPVSVTAVTSDTLQNAGVEYVEQASEYAPNVFFNEFTARKLSNPRFRGIGSSPNNPGITTYYDGVPQLNANSSSLELIDIDQIEFVRGPQGALFGRNTIGGLINVTSRQPSLANWTGHVMGPWGNYSSGGVEGTASGPLIADKLALGVGVGYSGRDGYTVNDVTGHDLDSRSAVYGKAQLLWVPAAGWNVRGLVTGERARDGDYALFDLGALRANPLHAAHDFEGFTHRDVVAPTLLVNFSGKSVDFLSTTGFVSWHTEDSTDLDYTPAPIATRDNVEHDHQFTQEFRFSSAKNASIRLADQVMFAWQAGLFLFTQDYTQDAVNSFSPFVLSPFLGFPVDQHSPQSELDDHGVGVYGRGTFTFNGKLDAVIGLRGDHEAKSATLNTFYDPPIAPPTNVQGDKGFGDVSPQFIVDYHVTPASLVYGSASRGYKAGGFNPASPVGSEAYNEEHSWNYEGGVKTSWAGNRVVLNGAVFFINWTDLQVNVPNPEVPAEFYIANAGTATSKGVELELTARLLAGLDIFAGYGYTNARFGDGSQSGGVNVSGNRISNMPDQTGNIGLQYSHALRPGATAFGRAELVGYGSYFYDDANTQAQSAYALCNFRGGARGARLFAEAWIRNAFNVHYIPVALPYPGLAPSGFVGENGPPRTFGIRAGVTF